WRSQAHALFGKNHLLHLRRTAATILVGPVQAHPTPVVQPFVPGQARRAARMLRKFVFVLPPLLAVGTQIRFQPGAKFLAKNLFSGRIGKIHNAALLLSPAAGGLLTLLSRLPRFYPIRRALA